MGPAGKDGANGTNGTNGTNGQDGASGTAECIACHSNSHRDPIKAAYAVSGHATGIYVNGVKAQHVFGINGVQSNGSISDRSFCSQCHSNQGFIDKAMTGSYNPAGYANPVAINCKGCHDSDTGHRSFDFAHDGNDMALRIIEPQTFMVDPSITIDMGDHSNICIRCHQPRPDSANEAFPPSGADLNVDFYLYDSAATITHDGLRHRNTNISGHESPQSAVWAGKLLYQLPGVVAYPSGPSGHSGATCIKCHMGTPSTDLINPTDGSHTWHPTTTECVKCHGSVAAIPAEVTDFTTDMDALKTALIANGIFTSTGSFKPGHYKLGIVQAGWNYKLLEGERSEGKHNPPLVKAILKNSKYYVEHN